MNTALTLDSPDRTTAGFAMAVAFHGLVLFLGAYSLSKTVEYGVDASQEAISVELTADEVAIPTPAKSIPVEEPAPAPEEITDHSPSEPLPQNTSAASEAPATPTALPHAATPSGQVSLQPGYYRNPPPHYPEEARRLKQEGRVFLDVLVTEQGEVGDISLKQTSGFPLLDEAAFAGVKHWRFKPARMNGLTTSARVEVPIRFQLK